MKFLPIAIVSGLTALVLLAQSSSELKHLPIAPESGPTAVTVSAREIERGTNYPAVVHLTGNVEIKMPLCVRSKSDEMVCDGELVLHADQADYYEGTGRVEARGNVSVTPTHHR